MVVPMTTSYLSLSMVVGSSLHAPFRWSFLCTDRTVQYKLNAQSLRLFGLHRDVNDAHRAGAHRLQNKTNKQSRLTEPRVLRGAHGLRIEEPCPVHTEAS